MRLAHLGPAGTFGEMAAVIHAPDAELVAASSHAKVFLAVLDGHADAGVLAVENSLEGSVAESLDLLIPESPLVISGELVVPIEHCLVAAPGVSASDVRVVHSHPQALAQCRRYLDLHYPDVRIEAALSTALGVKRALSEPAAAAIASQRAAEVYQAEILATKIQDREDNVTRFLIVSKRDSAPTGHDKTSLAFKTAHDRPGTLVAVLAELSSRGINLTKVESRPSKDALGVYVFLVDLEGHRSDAIVAAALERVREQTSWLRVLGSYPKRDLDLR